MMRLFLSDRLAGTLFATLRTAPPLPRDAYLRNAFSDEIIFVHRKRNYRFTPFKNSSPDIVSGVIAREHTITIGAPPEEGYKRHDVPDWDTANVFIDVSGDDDGQKVAMQDTPVIGRPLSVFRSLTDYINNRDNNSDWLIAVNTITSDDDFW